MSMVESFLKFGFVLLLTCIEFSESTCGDDVINLNATSESSGLFSPSYPYLYPSNVTCRWRITAVNERDRVYLYVTSVDLDNENETCADSLVVYDGYNQSAALLRQWCGRHDGDVTLRSGSNMLYVVFTSDAEGANKGFGIYYRAGEEKVCYGGVHELSEPTPATTSTNLDISYFEGQPRTGICLFRIRAAADHEIRITVSGNNFDSNSADGCNETYMILYDGFTEGGNTLGKFCGDVEHDRSTYTTSGRYLYMSLVTGRGEGVVNVVLEYYQFKAASLCHGRVRLQASYDERRIASPNFPRDYGPGLNCSYLINSEENQKRLFLMVLTQLPDDCSDKLVLFDGNSATSDVIAELCGTSNTSFNSSSHEVLVVFLTDSHMDEGGFDIRFRIAGERPAVYEVPQNAWALILTVVGSVNLAAIALFVSFCVWLHCRRKRAADTEGIIVEEKL